MSNGCERSGAGGGLRWEGHPIARRPGSKSQRVLRPIAFPMDIRIRQHMLGVPVPVGCALIADAAILVDHPRSSGPVKRANMLLA